MVALTLVIGCSQKKEESDDFEYYGTDNVSESGGQSVSGDTQDVTKSDLSEQSPEAVREEAVAGLSEEAGVSNDSGSDEGFREGKQSAQYVERSGIDIGSVAAGYMLGNMLSSPQRETTVIHHDASLSRNSVNRSGNNYGTKTTLKKKKKLVRVKKLRKRSSIFGKKKKTFFSGLKRKYKRSRTKSRSRSRRRR